MIKDFIFSLLQKYGNSILFLGLAAEYLGLPFVPGEAMMSFMGFLGIKGSWLATLYSIFFATAGTFAGSMIAWLIGYKYGEGVVLKLGKPIHLTKEKLDKARVSFDKRRVVLIIFSRFVPGVRHVIPYISGITKIEAEKYAVLNLAGAVLWCGSFIGLGSLLGEKWQAIVNLAKTYSLVLLLMLVFIFVTVKFFKDHQKIIFAIAFPLLLFIKISEDIVKQELSVFDNSIYKFVASFITEDMTDFMKFLTFLGSGLVLIFITAIVIIAVRKNKKYAFYGWMIGANLLASSILNELFKVIFHRERPDILRLIDITGFSFPSGHSMIGLCFYGFIAYILWVNMKSRWRYPLVILSVALVISIGISRIYLGVHYASDVLGGFSAGLAWLAAFIPISSRMYKTYSDKLQIL
ncbi:MAG: bifunctional DedA family/phosphatase PAP2 family protein [Clostridiales bacterium]|nr:bifunctional DedA family/phosphatase PAP2 family protein [Eubacteriales bacterium]MDH7567867.1 bifunctional DedA family/phosphatase PAP2 family protein [Clostridiales bacterium]